MKLFLSLCFFTLFSVGAFAQQASISGTITDDTGNPVPFVSIHIRNTTQGTSANSEGKYSLKLDAGKYELLYKAIGYRQEARIVTLKSDQILDIKLSTETYELKGVTIHGGGEDPAYAIIRKAIKKRKTYLNEVNEYSCDVYIKGLQKLLDAPKKFMGRDIAKAARENGLDSNRRGIVYLSESESKYSFRRPDQEHEEMISSKVSGRNNAFSFNRASDFRVNFYDNIQNWQGISNRPFISPIAENALFYYKYKYIGATEENGETVDKIQVIARRDYDPVFEGYIYIIDGTWRIHSIDLMMTKRSNINFLDTLKIKQQYLPAEKGSWMPSSVKFEFTGGFFNFKLGGYFIAIYKNYDLHPNFPKNEFTEVLRITKEVNKKDSTYWKESRPIPLTGEEVTDYKKKEILANKRDSKEYQDSLDKVNNKFKASDLLFGKGIHIRNRFEKKYYNFNSITQSLLYNTVEGVTINYGANFVQQIDSVNNRYLRIGANARYGFSDHKFHANANGVIPMQDFTFGFNVGSDVLDMNNRSPITPWFNTLHSLVTKENFEKLYEKEFIDLSLYHRIAGSWTANIITEYANRKWLPNTSDFSLFDHKGRQFTSNNPFVPTKDVPLFPETQAFKVSLQTSYDFGDKYETLPWGKHYLPSKYPRIDLGITRAFSGVFSSDADYTLLTADITKNDIPMGVFGRSSFYLGAGKFVEAKELSYVDYRHFSGDQILFFRPGINRFMLLQYYTYSTPDKYLEGHFEHNFSGFILNKIPLIRKAKLQEIVDVNYLSTPALKNYTELGFGLQYFGFRLMYGQSYNSGSNTNHAIRIGVGF